jgi:hypothetical protein
MVLQPFEVLLRGKSEGLVSQRILDNIELIL